MVLCGKSILTTLVTFSSVNQNYLSLSKANVVIAKALLSLLFLCLFGFDVFEKVFSSGLNTRKHFFLMKPVI